jgi:hypothetical protein
VKSQGLEPNAKSFCGMHELLYETKPWGKEQYHNNFTWKTLSNHVFEDL